MTTGITVFFAITISLLIFVSIGWNLRSIMQYKKAVEDLKVGDKYTITIEEDEFLFEKTEVLECTIIEIQYGKGKHPYVKYEFDDGSVGTERFDKFFKEFDKVN